MLGRRGGGGWQAVKLWEMDREEVRRIRQGCSKTLETLTVVREVQGHMLA
jgi:hypothetical protein